MDRVADDEITVVDDLPVTTLARTAFDLGVTKSVSLL